MKVKKVYFTSSDNNKREFLSYQSFLSWIKFHGYVIERKEVFRLYDSKVGEFYVQ